MSSGRADDAEQGEENQVLAVYPETDDEDERDEEQGGREILEEGNDGAGILLGKLSVEEGLHSKSQAG